MLNNFQAFGIYKYLHTHHLNEAKKKKTISTFWFVELLTRCLCVRFYRYLMYEEKLFQNKTSRAITHTLQVL